MLFCRRVNDGRRLASKKRGTPLVPPAEATEAERVSPCRPGSPPRRRSTSPGKKAAWPRRLSQSASAAARPRYAASSIRIAAPSSINSKRPPSPWAADNWFRTDRLTLELHTHPLHEPVKKITNSWNTYTLKSRTYNQLVAGPEGSGFGSSFFGAERRAGLFFLIIGASLRFSNSILNKSLKYCRVSGPDNSAFLIITDISCMNFSSLRLNHCELSKKRHTSLSMKQRKEVHCKKRALRKTYHLALIPTKHQI